MNRSFTLRSACLAFLLVSFAWMSPSAFAQRGGGGFHGGGGGFHGGMGGFHGASVGGSYGGYHGGGYGGGGYHGGYYGGYHGGYYGGYHGGYYGGYRGGYYGGWGCCGWGGWGWGFGVSLNFGGYWPSYYPYYYPYAYAAPYPYYPYPYPYYYPATPAGYVTSDPPSDNQPSGNVQDNLPPQQSSAPAARAVPYAASPRLQYAAPQQPRQSSSAVTVQYASYTHSRVTYSPEVQTAIRALRAMPPYAREQQLSRYGNLSPQQVNEVRQAVGMPPI